MAKMPSLYNTQEDMLNKALREVHLADDPKEVLRRYLSTRSLISTASSEAVAQQLAAESETPHKYVSLGLGTCGEVFDEFGKGNVLKKGHPTEYWVRDIRVDAETHPKVFEAFKHTKNCHVPRFLEFIEPTNDKWWSEHGHLFPTQKHHAEKIRTPVISSERILPLPKNVREAVIAVFCPLHLQERARKYEGGRDMLIKIYLGRRHKSGFFEVESDGSPILRNFPLTLEKVELLDLDANQLAISIADGLATMHWAVGNDARDVEFVLGTTPEKKLYKKDGLGLLPPFASTATVDFMRRTVQVWILDFNQTRPMTMDIHGCTAAAQAFWENDPYFPRPGATNEKDSQLWELFKNRYLEYSAAIFRRTLTAKELKDLPGLFINQVVSEGQRLDMGSGGLTAISGPPIGMPNRLVKK